MSGGQRGLSYVEVLIAVVLIAVALVPMMEALQSGINVGRAVTVDTARHYRLVELLEAVLAQPYAALDAAALAAGSSAVATSYSDSAGTANRRLVYLARYDLDNADGDGNVLTGGDAGLLWVSVVEEGTARGFATLTAP